MVSHENGSEVGDSGPDESNSPSDKFSQESPDNDGSIPGLPKPSSKDSEEIHREISDGAKPGSDFDNATPFQGLAQAIAKSAYPALEGFNSQMMLNVGRNLQTYSESLTLAMGPTLELVRAMMLQASKFPALSNAEDYKELDESESPYSTGMTSPQSYFGATEEVISCFDDLHRSITRLIARTPDLPLVWRGVRNADWGLHSHLYRHLMNVNGVVPPSKSPSGAQPYPDEDQMVAAEREILRIARRDWRFDDLSALETFARIQHAGGPTRLIDVSKNPYIGAWFAVELDEEQEDRDARLFAMATRPVAKEGRPPALDSVLALDDLGAAREPFWHILTDADDRQQWDWGTGSRRRIWVPPAYDPRISAQNAAFILDGVPMTSAKIAPYFKAGDGSYWRRADLLASASIYAKMLKPSQKPKYNARNFAPTFSFRIRASAKEEIREVMESRFGYRLSYIYPDVAALAGHLKTLKLAD